MLINISVHYSGTRTPFVSGQRLITTSASTNRRPTRIGLVTSAAFGFFRKKIATAGAIDDLLAAVESTERGWKTTRPQRAQIDAAVNVLDNAYDSSGEFESDLSATWKLLWTTEKVLACRNCCKPYPAEEPFEQHVQGLMACRRRCSYFRMQACSAQQLVMCTRWKVNARFTANWHANWHAKWGVLVCVRTSLGSAGH